MLHVAGHDRGKVEWLKPRTSASAKAKAAARANGEKPKPMSMAEKRKKLEGRRQAHALDATCEAVRKAATPSASTLILLAAAFGTEHKADRPGNEWHPKSKASPSLLGNPDSAHGALWKSVAEVIARRWQYALRTDGIGGLQKHTPEIAKVAELLSIDLAPFAAAAEKAIPEPKSWAKEPAKKPAAKKTREEAA